MPRPSVSPARPAGAVLISGGFGTQYGANPFPTLVTRDTHALGDRAQWQVGYTEADQGYELTGMLSAGAICVSLHPSRLDFITVALVRHLTRIPADTVVVATDGSAQVQAAHFSARVSQAQSGPIAAQQTTNPFTAGRIQSMLALTPGKIALGRPWQNP